jgi:hypothetical protein
MLKNIIHVAATAIVIVAFASTTAQAKRIEADTPKCERIAASQKLAKAQTLYLWPVLGVGY